MSEEDNIKNTKQELTVDQLITLYQHMTEDIRKRDNFFIPLSFAAIPAVVLSWKDLSWTGVLIIGISSIFFYLINLLFIFRFTAYQDETIRMLNKKTNFQEIVKVQKSHYFGSKILEKYFLIRIRNLRLILLVLIILIWGGILFVK